MQAVFAGALFEGVGNDGTNKTPSRHGGSEALIKEILASKALSCLVIHHPGRRSWRAD